VAIVDTNCDPDEVDYVIPGNDDAIRAIKLIANKIADAVIEVKGNEYIAEVETAEAVPEGTEELTADVLMEAPAAGAAPVPVDVEADAVAPATWSESDGAAPLAADGAAFAPAVTEEAPSEALADSYADLELQQAARTELADKDRAAGKTDI